MGTIKHNAIVVTGAKYAIDKLEMVHKKAQELVGDTFISNNKKPLERVSKFLRCSRW